MQYGIALIDKAGDMCGSFYKLSKETGFPQPHISLIRSGKRGLPLEWVPVLAEIAGVDAREALACVMAERLPEGSRARAILEGARAAFVAATLLFFVSLGLLQPLTGYAKESEKLNLLNIVECWLRAFCLFFMARSVRRWFSNTSPANDGRDDAQTGKGFFPRSNDFWSQCDFGKVARNRPNGFVDGQHARTRAVCSPPVAVLR